jgi:hypothetical protein
MAISTATSRIAFLVMSDSEHAAASAAQQAEAVRVQRLHEDARRPMSVNLAEGIALSHKLLQFTGAARKH